MGERPPRRRAWHSTRRAPDGPGVRTRGAIFVGPGGIAGGVTGRYRIADLVGPTPCSPEVPSMGSSLRLALAAALVAATASPGAAQQPARAAAAAAPAGLTADLLTDVGQLEKKVVGLARAIPADKFGWRPGQGVRSVGEVLMHVAADNYLLPAALGHAAAPSTGIKGDDYKTAQAYERRKLDRDATIAELERSFAHLKKSLASTTPARLGESVTTFGQPSTVQQTWILTTTHLHEHLGQLIAYARSNGVAPPWSQGG
jgi:uncharacterized damage-inducible protein DinB